MKVSRSCRSGEQDRLNAIAHAVRPWNLSGTCSISFIALMCLTRADWIATFSCSIVFEQWHRCRRDPLPWQNAVRRSVITNETTIKRTCTHFCLQSADIHTHTHTHTCIYRCICSWHRVERRKKKETPIEPYFRHILTHSETYQFFLIRYSKE